ncbi:MAG: BolA family transcriptional regulator [Proteobacteria bacterium]|nr:BolA family transcriptional regulator [Pseudomonadota bacterium]
MLKTRIETKLQKAFSPLYLKVEDDSHHHVGHAGHRSGGESHFSVIIASSVFGDLSRVQRHQKIYACLNEELKDGVHALCLKVLSPEEWAALNE